MTLSLSSDPEDTPEDTQTSMVAMVASIRHRSNGERSRARKSLKSVLASEEYLHVQAFCANPVTREEAARGFRWVRFLPACCSDPTGKPVLADIEQAPIFVLIAVVLLAAFIYQVSQPDTLGQAIAAWRGRMSGLRDAGLPREQLDAWIREGRELDAQVGRKSAGAILAGADTSTYDRLQKDIRDDIRAFEAAAATANASAAQAQTPSVDELAALRSEGLISEDEFKAFTERFRQSPGLKAQDLVAAIRDLHSQHAKGAMTQGNYHAALWTMLDRLDREMSKG